MATYRLPALLIVVLLSGCAAPGPATPPRSANETVTRQTVQGGRFIELIGPPRQFAAPFLGVPGTNFFALRSWIDTQSGNESTQLYVEDSYVGDERDYRAARIAGGNAGKFVPISKNEIVCQPGCSYAEEFAADLPAAPLAATTGDLTVVFSAKAGPDLAITVPAELIAEQRAAVAAARAGLPSAASGSPPAAFFARRGVDRRIVGGEFAGALASSGAMPDATTTAGASR